MNAFLAAVAVLGVSASAPLMASIAAPALAIAFWRNAAAVAVLTPWAAARSRTELATLGRRHVVLTVLAGVLLAGHFGLWVKALQMTSVAAATALVCTQVVWVVVLDRVLGTRAPRAVLLGCLLAVAGVVVVTGVDIRLSTEALVGDLLALLAGTCGAGYFVCGREVRTRLSTTGYTFACYGTCALVLAAVALATSTPLVGFPWEVWLLLAAVTVCAQLLGHSLLNHLLAVKSPTVISLLMLLEVPGAALLAAVFLGQAPGTGVYAGLVLILAGLAVVVGSRRADAEAMVEPPA
ncbi:DMT family transporter [Aeromicrobium sp. CTD01-1L150]|uniref:DMT family transporter n=1 Tax=Aeromicrobium sp. CTD01-1L150 TaxID=3341830 RepID=UPI0035BFD957